MTVPPTHPSPARRCSPRAWLLAVLALAATVSALAAAPPAEAAKAPKSFFGLSVVRPTAADFEGIGEIGAGSVRIEIAWPAAQATKNGPFNWGPTDERFRQAASAGLEPLPIIFGAPSYITGDSNHLRGPVKTKGQRQEWQQFAAAAAARYGPGGAFWTANLLLDSSLAPNDWVIWNEQNAREFWHPKASPKQYAQLLRITREAFDGVNPALRMTIGGMYGYPKHKKAMDAKPFLKKLYRQRGAKQAIDGASTHPYSKGIKGVKKQAKQMRQVMNKAGDRKARLYVGETGWASGGPKKSIVVTSKKGQARLLNRSYKFFLQKRKAWNVESVYWFTWRDYDSDPICNWCPKAGLLNQKGKLKPAGKKFRKLIAKKAG